MKQGIKLKPFDMVRHYRIVRHVADGGEGYVYLAQNTGNNNQICVVKQMFNSADELGNIERDYQLFTSFFHPNIVQTLDYFWDDDVFYIVMNYVAGQTMRSYLNKQKEPINEILTLSWISKLANVLNYLHGRRPQVIHADIAPDNVVITPNNDLIIIDFGIARVNCDAIGMREFYSAPEQIESGKLSPSTDVYSLGATAYKCLTLKDQPSPGYDPRKDNARITPKVAEFIIKATAAKPTGLFGFVKGRYKDMEEVLDALSECYVNSKKR